MPHVASCCCNEMADLHGKESQRTAVNSIRSLHEPLESHICLSAVSRTLMINNLPLYCPGKRVPATPSSLSSKTFYGPNHVLNPTQYVDRKNEKYIKACKKIDKQMSVHIVPSIRLGEVSGTNKLPIPVDFSSKLRIAKFCENRKQKFERRVGRTHLYQQSSKLRGCPALEKLAKTWNWCWEKLRVYV